MQPLHIIIALATALVLIVAIVGSNREVSCVVSDTNMLQTLDSFETKVRVLEQRVSNLESNKDSK